MTDKYNTHVDPAPSFERKIDIVIERVACEKHPEGVKNEPCYILPIDSKFGSDRSHNWGVCGWRARQAGFIGDKPAPKPRSTTRFVRS